MLPKHIISAGALSLALTGPALADEHIIVLTGFSYFPTITYAEPGDVVKFINQSGAKETVVGRNTGWTVGPLEHLEEGELIIDEETELAFFSAYQDCANGSDGTDGNCGWGSEEEKEDYVGRYGDYESATIKAEISFEAPPIPEN